MPTIYDLKPRFQSLLRPLTQRLVRLGITANQVTVTAMLLSCAVGAWIALMPDSPAPLLAVPGFLFLRMALNAIDGMIAREHDMKSDLGTFLNEIGDVVSDTALYLPLALVAGIHPAPVIVAVVLAAASEMTGVVAVQIGAERRYDGPMGKSDRAFVFGAICLLLGCGLETGFWANAALVGVDLLLAVTIVNRARRAIAQRRESTED